MGKNKNQPINSESYQYVLSPSYNLHQNYRRTTNNASISDLVTHKERQIEKKYKLGDRSNKTNDGSQDQEKASVRDQIEMYEFQCDDEQQNGDERLGQNHSRYSKKSQRQNKEMLLLSINKLMAKNKINCKTAFDIPILSIEDFIMYEDDKGQIAWKKMSSIIENGSKIYGIRVQSMEQFIRKMSDSLCRKNLQVNDGKQKDKKQDDEQDKIEKKNQQKSKMSQLTENRADLTVHLEKNSQNLDINLRTKLMMRKDPLFERTSRRFDYQTYDSFFMNTLAFTRGLFLQINASEEKQNKAIENQEEKMKQLKGIITSNRSKNNEEFNRNNSNSYSQWIDVQSLKSVNQQFKKINEGIHKIKQSIKRLKNQSQEFEMQGEVQSIENNERILNLLLQGKFKYTLQSNDDHYKSSESQQEEQNEEEKRKLKKNKKTNKNRKKDQNGVFENKNEMRVYDEREENKSEQNKQQNGIEMEKKEEENDADKMQEERIAAENREQCKENIKTGFRNMVQQKKQEKQHKQNGEDEKDERVRNHNEEFDKFFKNSTPDKKVRLINEVITMKENKKKVKDIIGTRKRSLNPQIKQIINSERKQQKKMKEQKEIFDTFHKDFKHVLKKQKVEIAKEPSRNSDHIQINLLQPALYCGFNTKYSTLCRPPPTAQELKIERNLQKQKYIQEIQAEEDRQHQSIQNERNGENVLENRVLQEDKSERQEQEEVEMAVTHRKQPNMKTIKQRIKEILKQTRSINFKELCEVYRNRYGELHKATMFIAMLHVTNEGFIKVKKLSNKNFQIEL